MSKPVDSHPVDDRINAIVAALALPTLRYAAFFGLPFFFGLSIFWAVSFCHRWGCIVVLSYVAMHYFAPTYVIMHCCAPTMWPYIVVPRLCGHALLCPSYVAIGAAPPATPTPTSLFNSATSSPTLPLGSMAPIAPPDNLLALVVPVQANSHPHSPTSRRPPSLKPQTSPPHATCPAQPTTQSKLTHPFPSQPAMPSPRIG